MSDQPRADRLLRLLIIMLGLPKFTLTELASRLEINERTVYRYLDTFKNQGFVIYKEGGHYKIDRNDANWKKISELLHFTEEESWILNKAILSLDDDLVIKQNLAAKLYSLYQLKGIPYPVIRKDQSDKICKLIRAIENQQTIVIKAYQSSNSSTVTDRMAEPFEFTLNYSFVWCFEHGSMKNKLFKTARIGKIESTEQQWQFRHLHKSDPTDIFRISGNDKIRVKLEMTMRAANLLIEEYPASEDYISQRNDGKFTFDGIVHSFEGIGRFILGLPEEIIVNEPNSFRMFLNEKIRKKTW